MTEFKNYIKELQSETIDNLTEHSKRSALEILMKSVAIQINDKIKILHEPKRKENYGSPDFLIHINNSVIGYIENKKITENLSKTLKTAQIKKYRELSDNILLTNYIEFIWIKKDVIERETLCSVEDLTGFKNLSDLNVQKVSELIKRFMSQAPIGVSTTKELAVVLAIRAKNLKIYLLEELKYQKKENQLGRLFGLFQTFKENVSSDLKLEEFADAFAQMLVYGLFLAKLNMDTVKTHGSASLLNLRNAEEFIPKSFQLIRELVSFFDELEKEEYKETRWIIEETISIMNNLQLAEIKKSLSFMKNQTGFENLSALQETDPYIYFYEDFLAAYDSKLRKAKGVYYTPPQVVSFIVSAINQILTDDFKMLKGLAQHDKVTALDFATGTGTFLTEIFKQVLETSQGGAEISQGVAPSHPLTATPSHPLTGEKKLIIKNHLLKNIYGFEYLIAPYTITHLKLSQLLKENDYELSAKERLQVYLTNTLEPAYAKVNLFLQALSEEGKLAKQAKENPVLVITGNPPYSISSSNNHPMIIDLLKNYKTGLKERKINLDDDYIKFIRFAHDKIARYKQGVVAVITNNSFLDGITHRRMRESLLNDFDKIYIINLHGNSLKKEGDENVFDIRVGVAISIFIKTPKPLKNKEVYYFSTKDNKLIKRQEKYDFLTNNSLKSIDFEKLKPQKPNFWFVKKDLKYQKKYNKGFKITDIFHINSNGFESQNDAITVQFSEEEILKLKREILDTNEEDFFQKYNLSKKRDWIYEKAKLDLKSLKNTTKINYHIFDERYTYFSQKSKGFIAYPRTNVMQHFENKDNLGIVATRQVATGDFNHVFITDKIINRCFLSNKTRESNSVFPLYVYNSKGNTDENGNGYLFKEESKRDNFTTEFRKFIKTKYKKTKADNNKNISDLQNEIKNDEKIIEETKTILELQTDETIIESLQQIIEETNNLLTEKQQKLSELKNQNSSSNFVPAPEQVLGYIYAILHSPTYRKKYAEFLKFDFPRIPFTDDSAKFKTLSKLGWQLIQTHLLNEIPQGKEYENLAIYMGSGENIVEKTNYSNGKLYINKEQYFDNIPEQVYEFKIGAYQVLHKYLKDRKGRNLSLDDIMNIENICKSLKFTITQMKLIDNFFNE